VLTFSISKAVVADLKKLVNENNRDELAKKLLIDAPLAKSINDISVETSIEKSENLKEQEKTILILEMKSYDPRLFGKIQPSIIKFFQTNEYSLVREKEKKALYQGMIDKTTQEINELEKLRAQFLAGTLFKNSNANTILFDPTTINSRMVDLAREMLKNQNDLALVNSIQVIQGFTNFDKPVSPKLSTSLASGASLGVFFVLALIGAKGFHRMVKLASEKQN
jgi:hypothetical protein